MSNPGIRIAVADDDQMVRSALRNFLANEPGFEWVGEAQDGEDAIKLVQAMAIDVLILDLAMPRMGGLQALPRLRELAPRTRVLMFSSFPDIRHREQALQLGAAGYLLKGCDPQDIVDAVRAAMGRSER